MFVPFCPGGAAPAAAQYPQMPPMPQVPYPCSQCHAQRDLTRDARTNDSFRQVLAQAGVSALSDAILKSPHRKTRTRKIKTEEEYFFVPREGSQKEEAVE